MDNEENERSPGSLKVASLAIMTAMTVVVGYIRVPLPATQGIFTLGDIAIYFTAFCLGPFSGAVAGGLGAALIDLIGGTAQYAPVSFVVHGLQGLLAGLIAAAGARQRTDADTARPGGALQGTEVNAARPGGARRSVSVLLWIIAGLCGTVIMAGGYLLAETLFYGGFAKAVTEVVFNVAQSLTGAVGGVLLTVAVRRAYPPVSRLRW
jgi:uncharacterized membrane protein